MFTLIRYISPVRKYSKFSNSWLRNMTIYTKHLESSTFLKPGCNCTIFENRTLMRYFKTPSIEDYKVIDNIPEPYSLIYQHKAAKHLFLTQVLTTVSSAIIIIISCFNVDLFSEASLSQLTSGQKVLMTNAAGIFSFYLILQIILNQMPMRIYYLSPRKEYIFVFYGIYLTRRKHVKCRTGEIIKLQEASIPPWKDSNYIIKEKQYLLLFENYFRKSDDLLIMLGKQKDPDIEEAEELPK